MTESPKCRSNVPAKPPKWKRREDRQGREFVTLLHAVDNRNARDLDYSFLFTAIPQDLAKKGWRLDENLPHGRS